MDRLGNQFVAGFAVGVAATVVAGLGIGVFYLLVRPWLRCTFRGGKCSLVHVLGIRLRGLPVMLIVDAYTSLIHQGEEVRLAEVESSYLAHRDLIQDSRDLAAFVSKDSLAAKG